MSPVWTAHSVELATDIGRQLAKTRMLADLQMNAESLDRFRALLLMLARAQIGPKYRARIDPEAIVNQTLFEAHQQRDQYLGSTEASLSAWLRKMLDNNVMDAMRHAHREKRDVDREHNPAGGDWTGAYFKFLDVTCSWTSPSMNLIKYERELQLAKALAQLPEAQRDAVELHHLHGCTLAETADDLERTVAAVVGLLRRGLRRLRELLQESSAIRS